VDALFWIIAIILLIIGILISAANWIIFVKNYILQRKWASAVPFLGGISGAIGIISLPIAGSACYFWIPLIVDWGSLPAIIFSLIARFREKAKA
jgi:hypothetical protein